MVNDSDVLNILKFIRADREALIYIEHLNHPQPIEPSSLPSNLHEDEEPVLDFSFLDDTHIATPETEAHSDHNVEDNSDCHSDSDDSDVLIDSDYDMIEDDKLYEKYVDHDVEFVGLSKSSDPLNNILGDEVSSRLEGDTLEPVNSSDELESLVGSDEDDLCMPKYPKYNPATESRKPVLKLGLNFSSKQRQSLPLRLTALGVGSLFSLIGMIAKGLGKGARLMVVNGKHMLLQCNMAILGKLRCSMMNIVRRRYPTKPPSALPHNPISLKKHQRSVTCRVCGQLGHNARKHKKADQNEEQEEVPLSESQPPPASDHVTQSEGVTYPVVVKGGVNYITDVQHQSCLEDKE
ncbi:mutator transposable element [Striga asiatica]|uniref:Mutator transposable element n=1 Tax=Striga asiatica TaxID=4170 RepID=A0A5A7R1Z2_STRAF|nr:mutator transposable element [Striga asiatica]